MSEAVLREAYEGRLVALTGQNWCPYPSGMFMEAVVELPDDAALTLIKDRRKMGFGMFCGLPDPQTAAIEAALAKARGEVGGREIVSLPDMHLYDSDTGASLPTEHIVDISHMARRRAFLLYTTAKRGPIVQILRPYADDDWIGTTIHFFVAELDQERWRRPDDDTFGSTAHDLGFTKQAFKDMIEANYADWKRSMTHENAAPAEAGPQAKP